MSKQKGRLAVPKRRDYGPGAQAKSDWMCARQFVALANLAMRHGASPLEVIEVIENNGSGFTWEPVLEAIKELETK